jgi:hypothetical protein
MTNQKTNSFWQKLKDFFNISDKDLKAWEKRNYQSRQQMRFTSHKEDKEYNDEYDRKNRRD